MKKFILTFVALVSALVSAMALITPEGIAYQAVLRDADGKVVASKEVDVVVKIVYGEPETSFYTEKHSAVMTDEFGLLSLTIGKGTRIGGLSKSYKDVYWLGNRRSVIVEVDIDRDGTADITSKDIFGDVPYAYYSMYSQDYQNSAAKSLTKDQVTYVQNAANDNPLAKVTVSISNKGNKPEGWWVEILGQKINAENPTATFWVPAYSPVFMSWEAFLLKGGVTTSVFLNNKGVDTYETVKTVNEEKVTYIEVKVSDYALIATRQTNKQGDYLYDLLSSEKILENNKNYSSKIKLSETGFSRTYGYADNYNDRCSFTHPASTRYSSSDSYIGFETTLYYPKQEIRDEPLNSVSYRTGKNFVIGPFDPTKENTIEIMYSGDVY